MSALFHGGAPPDEQVLWEGRPTWQSILRHVFHVRALVLYFIAIVIWQIADALSAGEPGKNLMASTAGFAGLALACLAILSLMAWLIWRTTTYLITDRRVDLRFGVALPATLDVPLNLVQNASVKMHSDGTGDISIELPKDQRIAPLLLWPHLKPWQLTKPEPMLRGISEPEKVAELFATALSAHGRLNDSPAVDGDRS
jgi:hypothetical protein